MYVQIVNFTLKDMTEAAYREACEQEAATFGAMPKLVAKYWLADPGANTYGGVYIWESREALDDYLNGEVWAAITGDPHLANVTSREFGILDGPTRATREFPEAALTR